MQEPVDRGIPGRALQVAQQCGHITDGRQHVRLAGPLALPGAAFLGAIAATKVTMPRFIFPM